ncbi:MAG: AzlD domain-containing protein [Bacillota bacterium]
MRWLNYVPEAIMAALVGQELILPDEKLSFQINLELLAALPTFAVAIAVKMYKSKDYTIKQITAATGISKTTLYRYLDKVN